MPADVIGQSFGQFTSRDRFQIFAEKFFPLLFVFLILFVSFLPIGWLRLVDRDEGYYIFQSKLVMQGKILYKDFFFAQMPLLPYVYGIWMKVFGFSWDTARCLSALCSALLGVLIYAKVQKAFPDRKYALLALLLYVLSSHVTAWYTIVKTYALSTLFLFVAYYIQSDTTQKASAKKLFFSGLFLGLAIDTRLFFAALILAFLIDILSLNEDARRKFTLVACFGLGTSLALCANLPFLIYDSDNYIFNNVVYHSLRSEYGFIGGINQKLDVVRQLFGMYQFVFLFLSGVVAYFLLNFKQRLSLSFYVAVFLFLVSLLPSPTFEQYFCTLVPFLIINSISVIEVLSLRKPGRGFYYLFLFLIFLYGLALYPDLNRYTRTGKDVPGMEVGAKPFDWKISTIQRVSKELNVYSRPKYKVFSVWPGYFIESDVTILPKTETHFAIFVSTKLSQAQLDKYRIMSYHDLGSYLRNRLAQVIIVGNCMNPGFRKENRNILINLGYKWVREIGNTDIYEYDQK